jgi:hypothetical protein
MSRPLSALEAASKLLTRLENPSSGSINEDEIKVMRNLLTHVVNLESSQQSSSSLSQTSYSSVKSEPKISQPQYFSGDRKHITEFITQLKMVFSLQASRFPTEKSKVIYACSYLRNSAFTWAQPMLETLNSSFEDSHLNNFQDFSEKLRAAFGDPDPIATAQRQLYKLTQGSQSAAEYAANFQRFSTLTKWNDDALKYHFTHGLNEDLQDELATRDLPSDFSSYVSKVIALDNQIRERRHVRHDHHKKNLNHFHPRHDRNSNSSFSNKVSNYGHRHANHSHSNNQKPPNETFSSAKNSSENSAAVPMEIGASRKQFSTLSADEKKRRIEQKLCLYCGQPGHVAKACPVKFHRSQDPKNLSPQY